MAHSGEDKAGRAFFDRLFASSGVIANWYPYTDGRSFPHSVGIRKAIEESSSLFVVLSKEMEPKGQTRSWVSYEAGIAVGLNRPIWVFEPIGQKIELPVPGPWGYIQRPETTSTFRTFPYQLIVSSAGTQYPRADSDVWFHAICGDPECGERFVALILEPANAKCPACRKDGTIRKQDQTERRIAILEEPLLKPSPNRPREVEEAVGLGNVRSIAEPYPAPKPARRFQYRSKKEPVHESPDLREKQNEEILGPAFSYVMGISEHSTWTGIGEPPWAALDSYNWLRVPELYRLCLTEMSKRLKQYGEEWGRYFRFTGETAQKTLLDATRESLSGYTTDDGGSILAGRLGVEGGAVIMIQWISTGVFPYIMMNPGNSARAWEQLLKEGPDSLYWTKLIVQALRIKDPAALQRLFNEITQIPEAAKARDIVNAFRNSHRKVYEQALVVRKVLAKRLGVRP